MSHGRLRAGKPNRGRDRVQPPAGVGSRGSATARRPCAAATLPAPGLTAKDTLSITFTYVLKIGRAPVSARADMSRTEESTVKGERLGEFEELVLLSVRQLGDEAHGASIQEVLAERAGREVTLGAIYAALDRAQRKGLADSWLGEPTPTRGGRAKRHYAVTPEGVAALEESRRIREGLWDLAGEARS